MFKRDVDITTKNQKASTRSSDRVESELSTDLELKSMVDAVLNTIQKSPASYAKKERALIITNELLFLELTTKRQD